VYELPAGGVDGQQPHAEDEVYYIVNGRATLRIGEDEHPVEPGSVAFVAAQVPHAFHSIIEPLTALVFFAPPEGGAAWDSLDATREALRVDDAPVTAECA
jgi:mannose-6-phosphate isomerase-like protein (cupin superfamily)